MKAAPIPPPVVDALAQLLARLLRFDGPADSAMSRFFRERPQLGGRDRSLIAEGAFDAMRRLATLSWMMAPAVPERATRLAALMTLARQHGADALDARTLAGDARAVKNALARDPRQAPVAVRCEVPAWALERIEAQYPDFEPLLAANARPAPLDLRVNTIKADRAEVLDELARARAGARATPYSPDGVRLDEKPALTRWPIYKEGRVEVQDEGSQLIARLVAPRRGQMVADLCAGAGGKTLALGSLMRSSGRIYAFDNNARRISGLAPRLKRSGLSNVHPVAIASENDLRVKRLGGKFDRVLVDAPCSGSGTWRRNPDLKWRFDEGEIARLGEIQSRLLRAGSRLLKPGGRLVYATCSLLQAENQQIVGRFLDAEPRFAPVAAAEVLHGQQIEVAESARFAPWFVMLPHLHATDGFFAAVLEQSR